MLSVSCYIIKLLQIALLDYYKTISEFFMRIPHKHIRDKWSPPRLNTDFRYICLVYFFGFKLTTLKCCNYKTKKN